MVRMVEPEVARASSALWAFAASLSAKRSALMWTARLPNLHRMSHIDFRNNVNYVIL